VATTRAKSKIEITLPTYQKKVHKVRFETDEQGLAANNIYLSLEGWKQLGEPQAIKVTIEAA
jgi:hypothetical protein